MTTEVAKRATPRPSLLARVIGPLISLLCVGAAGLWVSQQPAPEFPRSAGAISLLAAACGTTLLLAGLRGWRWKHILGMVGARRLGVEPYTLTLVGYMGNTVFPARGGDLMRIGLLVRRRGTDWKTTAGTLVPERLLDLIALGLALTVLSVSGSARDRLGVWPAVLAVVGLVGIAGAVLGYHELRVRGRLQALADRVRPFTRATRALLGTEGALLLLASIGLWFLEASVLWLVITAASDEIPFFAAAFVVVLASLSTAVPAAPGFIGTFDAAVIFGLQAAGVPADATLALAVLYRVVLFGPVTIAGALTMLLRYGGVRATRLRRAPALATADDPDHSTAYSGTSSTNADGDPARHRRRSSRPWR